VSPNIMCRLKCDPVVGRLNSFLYNNNMCLLISAAPCILVSLRHYTVVPVVAPPSEEFC
jgi:hypothetical protein